MMIYGAAILPIFPGIQERNDGLNFRRRVLYATVQIDRLGVVMTTTKEVRALNNEASQK